jgi:hypothetical protein
MTAITEAQITKDFVVILLSVGIVQSIRFRLIVHFGPMCSARRSEYAILSEVC